MKVWLLRGAVALGFLYPASLLACVLLLSTLGEQFWLTGVVLYLPRAGFLLPLPFVVGALAIFRLKRLLLLQLLSVALVVFPLMGFVLPWFASRDDDAKTLRVLSCNINSGYGGVEHVLDEIAHFAADLVVLQEIGPTGEQLAQRLRSRYPRTLVSTQFLTASRYPILSTRDPPRIPMGDRMRSPRFLIHNIDTPLGEIVLYNVHPLSPREGLTAIRGAGVRRELASGRLLMATNADQLVLNSALRTKQVEAIASKADAEDVPVIIAGDTNLPDLSPLLRRHFGAYQDGFSAVGWGLGYTFPNDKRFAWMRIDRILASQSLRFVHFEVGTSRMSDHRCVMAELQRREP